MTPEASAKMSQEEVEAHILGAVIVQQFTLRAGMKKFGDKAT